MNFDEVLIVGNKPLAPVSVADVEEIESQYWISMPEGYREFITRYGEGFLAETFIRIYAPWRIQADLHEWRRRIDRYWAWGDDESILPKDRALECVIIGDTMNGDELIFHPGRPQKLFVLPRDAEHVFFAGANLADSIEWMCTSGELTEPISTWDFDPFDSRVATKRAQDADSLDDPEGESLDDIMEFGKRWAERHSMKKLAKADLKNHAAKGCKTELLYEGILFAGKMPYDSGYTIAYRILDKASGLETGILRFHWEKLSFGSAYSPNRENRAKLNDSM